MPLATSLTKGEWSARYGEPFVVEDRVDQLALPFVLDPFVLDQVRLLPHPQLLQDAGGRGVTCLGSADHAMQFQVLERQPEDRCGLRRT